jgi:signal transduction histidine kinase
MEKHQEAIQWEQQCTELVREMGTPLNVVLGRAELLLNNLQDEEAREAVKLILAQGEELSRLRRLLLEWLQKSSA